MGPPKFDDMKGHDEKNISLFWEQDQSPHFCPFGDNGKVRMASIKLATFIEAVWYQMKCLHEKSNLPTIFCDKYSIVKNLIPEISSFPKIDKKSFCFNINIIYQAYNRHK